MIVNLKESMLKTSEAKKMIGKIYILFTMGRYNLTMILFVLLLFSCKNEDKFETLKNISEKKLLKGLDNPESYEFISFEYDTIGRYLSKNRINDLNIMKSKVEKGSIDEKVIMDEIRSTRVYNENEIEFLLKFRATNKFNALIINSINIISDKDYNFLRIDVPHLNNSNE